LNSTHLPRTEKAASKQRVRTNHIHEDRWRALIDSDSGTDASDDDDADATNSSEDSDVDDGHVTYLDLTKDQVEVVNSPDGETAQKCRCFDRDFFPAIEYNDYHFMWCFKNPNNRKNSILDLHISTLQ